MDLATKDCSTAYCNSITYNNKNRDNGTTRKEGIDGCDIKKIPIVIDALAQYSVHKAKNFSSPFE